MRFFSLAMGFLTLFFTVLLALPDLVYSASVTVSRGSVTPKGVNSQQVSSRKVHVSRISGGTTGVGSHLRSYPVQTFRGNSQQKVVLAPLIGNTILFHAEYLTPNPADEEHPFTSRTGTMRFPLAGAGNLFWVPNQYSLVYSR